MARGVTHRRGTTASLVLGFCVGLASVLMVPEPATLAIVIGSWLGLAAGHLITPDIDHPEITIEEGRIMNIARPIGWLWRLFWWPYTLVFQHRGWSHTVPIGTLSRMIYIGVPVGILLWLFDVNPTPTDASLLRLAAISLMFGWMLQDLIHLALDGLLLHPFTPRKHYDQNTRFS